MSAIAGIKAVSLFDREVGSATEGVVVQKNRIVANQGEAVLQNMITEEDSMGLELHAGDESVFEFACYDDSGDDQLEAWAKADKEVELVTAGIQENVLWYEPATIKLIKPFGFATKNRNYRRIRIMKSGGQHKVARGVNLIDVAVRALGNDFGWSDSDANNVPQGFTFKNEGGAATNIFFSANNFSYEITTVGTNTYLKHNLIFPISGIHLRLSEEKLAAITDQTRLEVDNFADTVLSSQNNITGEIARRHVDIITPNNTWRVESYLIRHFASGLGNTHITSYPALRVDGSSEYIAG